MGGQSFAALKRRRNIEKAQGPMPYFWAMASEKIILGIDPGTNFLGYGIIRCTGQKMEMLALGTLILNKLANHQLKLKKIFERVTELAREYRPDEMAVEAPFFGKNVQSMLKLGRAQGVVMAAGLALDIPIVEYAPRKIKQSITGSGSASKPQVAAMLEHTLQQKIETRYEDATDGLAVAVCHFYQGNAVSGNGGGAKSWAAFIKQNPEKIRQ